MNKQYRKGYIFETKVKKAFEKLGCLVVRQGKSSFPDLIVLPTIGDDRKPGWWQDNFGYIKDLQPLFIECKKGKYLSLNDKTRMNNCENYGIGVVAFPEKNPEDRRKIDIVIAEYKDYDELFRL